jgi:hypothetical protein
MVQLIDSVVIADEAHRLKEPRAAVTIALKSIQCASCFGLTGTLIQNRMDEMWSVLDFVSIEPARVDIRSTGDRLVHWLSGGNSPSIPSRKGIAMTVRRKRSSLAL